MFHLTLIYFIWGYCFKVYINDDYNNIGRTFKMLDAICAHAIGDAGLFINKIAILTWSASKYQNEFEPWRMMMCNK